MRWTRAETRKYANHKIAQDYKALHACLEGFFYDNNFYLLISK